MDETHTTADAMEAAALPRSAELRADGRDDAVPVPAALSRSPARSPAEWAYQRVILYLRAFEERLADDRVVAVATTGVPGGLLRIEGVGFHAPDLVTFTGVDQEGHPAQAIRHVTQLDLVLRAVPRPEDRPEPERIGFRLARALEHIAGASDEGPAPAS